MKHHEARKTLTQPIPIKDRVSESLLAMATWPFSVSLSRCWINSLKWSKSVGPREKRTVEENPTKRKRLKFMLTPMSLFLLDVFSFEKKTDWNSLQTSQHNEFRCSSNPAQPGLPGVHGPTPFSLRTCHLVANKFEMRNIKNSKNRNMLHFGTLEQIIIVWKKTAEHLIERSASTHVAQILRKHSDPNADGTTNTLTC